MLRVQSGVPASWLTCMVQIVCANNIPQNVPSFGWITRVTQCGPSAALHPFPQVLLISCRATRIKYSRTHSKLSVSSIQRLYVFSAISLPSAIPSSAFFSPTLQFPIEGTLGSSRWGNGKLFFQQQELLLSKARSTMSHLMSEGKEAARCPPRNTQGCLKHPLFIHPAWLLTLPPIWRSFIRYTKLADLIGNTNMRTTALWFSPKAKPLRWLKTAWWARFSVAAVRNCERATVRGSHVHWVSTGPKLGSRSCKNLDEILCLWKHWHMTFYKWHTM